MIDTFINSLNELSKDTDLDEVYVPIQLYQDLGNQIARHEPWGTHFVIHTPYSRIAIYYHSINEILYTKKKLTKEQLLKSKFDKQFNNKLEDLLK